MGEEFEGLSGLEGGGEVDGSGEDAGGVAGVYRAGGRSGEDAGEAGCVIGEDVHGGGVGADGGGIDPGDGVLYGVVVEEITGFKVVSAIQQEVGVGEERGDVGGDKVCDDGLNLNGGVDEGEVVAGGLSLGGGVLGVGFFKEDLALEVGVLDDVTVNEGEVTDAGAGEE